MSITGYGRREPELVAFGDDAAVAGGLVGWSREKDRGQNADSVGRTMISFMATRRGRVTM